MHSDNMQSCERAACRREKTMISSYSVFREKCGLYRGSGKEPGVYFLLWKDDENIHQLYL